MTKKRPFGIKAEVRAEKARERRIVTAVLLVSIMLLVAFSISPYIYSFLNSSQEQIGSPSGGLKAAIVDQVSLTFPNETFAQTALKMLEQKNYSVDYYSGEKVTVDFYRKLPTYGYQVIILRVHSSADELQGSEHTQAPVCLFTSESYSTSSHVVEQLNDELMIASYSMPQPEICFAITPAYVESCMEGRFQNTTVVMMGCEGLSNTRMAEAFIKKGAKTYVGWTGPVSPQYTDQAMTQLLQHLVTRNETVKQAVENTMREVGPDQAYVNALEYYPLASGNHTIQR